MGVRAMSRSEVRAYEYYSCAWNSKAATAETRNLIAKSRVFVGTERVKSEN
jgi:hypothetical protein